MPATDLRTTIQSTNASQSSAIGTSMRRGLTPWANIRATIIALTKERPTATTMRNPVSNALPYSAVTADSASASVLSPRSACSIVSTNGGSRRSI